MNKPTAVLTDNIHYAYNHMRLNNLIVSDLMPGNKMIDIYGREYIIFHEDNMTQVFRYEIQGFIFMFSGPPKQAINRSCFVELVESRIR